MKAAHQSPIVRAIPLLYVVAAFATLAHGRIIYVDDDASGAGDGSTWAQAHDDLSEALVEAGASQRPVEIRVAQGIYRPRTGQSGDEVRDATFLLASGVTLRGGYAGLAGPDPDARDTTLYRTVLSGDLQGNDVEADEHGLLLTGPQRADNSLHVVTVRGGHDGPAVLDGLTISGGNAESQAIFPCFSPQRCGGGLHSRVEDPYGPCEVVVRSCLFKTNSAGLSGGAIYHHSAGAMSVVDCAFTDNCAQYGGTVAVGGDQRNVVTLTGCSFARNRAWDGGALHSQAISVLWLTGCAFRANRATRGGAVFVSAGATGMCEVALSACLFAGNRADRHAWVVLDDPDIPGTVAPDISRAAQGGSVYMEGPVRSVLGQCTFAGNAAEDGGILVCGTTPQNVPGTMEVRNCILWDEGQPIRNLNAWPIGVAYTDARGSQSRIDDPHGTLVWGAGNIDADPCFADPGYWDANGTPDEPNDDFWVDGDYHLKSQAGRWDPSTESWVQDAVTSPCIDAGDPNSDWSGETWPHGERINMGAYGGTRQASMSLRTQGMSLARVAYIFSHDTEVAESFQSLLGSYGCPTTLIRLADVPTTPLDSYDSIIVASDTQYEATWSDPNTVGAIEDSGKPIVGLGDGGYDFFGLLGLSIGNPMGGHGSENSIEVVDPHCSLFSTPYSIEVPEDRVLRLYTETDHVGIYLWPTIPETVAVFGNEVDDAGYFPLIMEHNRYLLWGFTESPQKMTEVGKMLFINVVIRTANGAWGS